MQFELLGNLKGFDLVAGGRARQQCPRLEKRTGQDPRPFAVRGRREALAHGY